MASLGESAISRVTQVGESILIRVVKGIWIRGLSDVVSTGVSEDLAGEMQIQELRDRVIFLEKTLRQAKVVKKSWGRTCDCCELVFG